MDATQNRTAFPPPPKGGGFHAEDTVTEFAALSSHSSPPRDFHDPDREP
jgi:hypothetical protein